MEIQIQNLIKIYKANKAIDHLCMKINPGIHGLLGPNGAGKTTLMRILATVLDYDSGEIRDDHGHTWKDGSRKPQIGYLPQQFGMYRFLRVEEALQNIALLKNIPRNEQASQIQYVMDIANLNEYAGRKVGQLSGGMLRRLGIAQAMIGQPEFLILDEPSVGLDPSERLHFRKMMQEYRKPGRIILISSHIVQDLESICDNISIMRNGKVIKSGTVIDILEVTRGKVAESMMSEKELQELDHTHHIIRYSQKGDGYIVRYLVHEEEIGNTQAELEDSYVFLMNEEGNGS